MSKTHIAVIPIGVFLTVGVAIVSCANQPKTASGGAIETTETPRPASIASTLTEDSFATITAVIVTPGDTGTYTFAVTVSSPDTGCEQYADWWEVLTPEGELLYRRILAHSHVDEQPFERTGGPVSIRPDQTVIIRAHMHPHGYGVQAMQGTVTDGFEETTLADGFAAEVALAAPQPNDCTF